MIFQGEEMSIGIRGFTIGYDFYAPERSVCFHHYAEGKNAKARNKGEAREHLEMYDCCEYRSISRLSLVSLCSATLLGELESIFRVRLIEILL
jgi:hypothetical protein